MYVGWGGPELRVDAIEVEIAEYRHLEDHSDHDQQYDHGPPPMSARTGDVGGKLDSGACIGGLDRNRPVRFPEPTQDAQYGDHPAPKPRTKGPEPTNVVQGKSVSV